MNNSDQLYEIAKALLNLRNKEEISSFLQDILTSSEQETVALRWEVAKMLDQGIPYTQIERETGASSATIAKVSEYLKYGYNGYRMALDRLQKKSK
ncbi:DNA-binding transcriptional regulator [Candidatus Dojkabacteria bacterium]|uniref:DNA-binding transcriptional regulator n=1 Tax=Candidatus Dojkabacteria bacterium TaxID=2099670 RepID=A0A955L506_9BACT|nr:DNA-binding transcriptional regulator [Candidatus Dojkabacteria bacterium]